MITLLDDFDGLLDETPKENLQASSKKYIEDYELFKVDNQLTFSGVYKSNIEECTSIEESDGIPWSHTCITLDVSKLRDISKPRLSQFSIPGFIEEIRGIGDANNSGFGYNECGRNHVQSVMIPSSVYEIAKRSFAFYRKLESVVIQEESRLSIIGDEAFAYCESLKVIDISECKGISELSHKLFTNSAIKTLKINSNIRKMYEDTFEDCSILRVYVDDKKYLFKDFLNRLINNGYEAFWM